VRKQVLTRRYTQGLVDAIESREEFQAVTKCLVEFQELMVLRPQFREALSSPFFPHSKRASIASEVLSELYGLSYPPQSQAGEKASGSAGVGSSPEAKAKRFLLLLVENERLEILNDILELFPVAWEKEHGVVSFEVSSVIELSGGQKERLAEKLRRLENKPVTLKFMINPSIVGGLSIRKGNILYDVSIAGSLAHLKEIICEN